MKSQVNIRASALLQRQLEELTAHLGTSITETVSLAIDRMYQQEIETMTEERARQLAERSISIVEKFDGIHNHKTVSGTTVVGFTDGTFWVTDNGEEVSGLSKEKAIEIIVENLTTGDDE